MRMRTRASQYSCRRTGERKGLRSLRYIRADDFDRPRTGRRLRHVDHLDVIVYIHTGRAGRSLVSCIALSAGGGHEQIEVVHQVGARIVAIGQNYAQRGCMLL